MIKIPVSTKNTGIIFSVHSIPITIYHLPFHQHFNNATKRQCAKACQRISRNKHDYVRCGTENYEF